MKKQYLNIVDDNKESPKKEQNLTSKNIIQQKVS